MRLSCRRRSVSSSEDNLANKSDDDEDEDVRDESVLRERQCGRRMAVVLD